MLRTLPNESNKILKLWFLFLFLKIIWHFCHLLLCEISCSKTISISISISQEDRKKNRQTCNKVVVVCWKIRSEEKDTLHLFPSLPSHALTHVTFLSIHETFPLFRVTLPIPIFQTPKLFKYHWTNQINDHVPNNNKPTFTFSLIAPLSLSLSLLQLPTQPWRMQQTRIIISFRGSFALSKTTIGVSEVVTRRLQGFSLSIPGLNSIQISLMRSFGWVPMILDHRFCTQIVIWIMGLQALPSSLGFLRTLMCLVTRFCINGVVISLSYLRYVNSDPLFLRKWVSEFLSKFEFLWYIFFFFVRCCLWRRLCQYRLTQIRIWLGFCINCSLICIRMGIINLRWLWQWHSLRLFVDLSLLRYWILWFKGLFYWLTGLFFINCVENNYLYMFIELFMLSSLLLSSRCIVMGKSMFWIWGLL